MYLKIFVFFALTISSLNLALAETKKRTIDVSFEFNHLKLKNRIQLFEVPSDMITELGAHGIIKKGEAHQFNKRLPIHMEMKRGEVKYFAMIYDNEDTKPEYFYASFHTIKPTENTVGFSLKCLCMNKIFIVPPNSKWWRIGSVTISKDFIGDSATFKHDVIGMTSEEISKKKMGDLVDGL